MTPRRRHFLPQGSVATAIALALLSATAWADEVVLTPGATVKGAVSGRVRGQIQSETADEVVVKLGVNTINVPTDQVVSVRYDGQPPSMALAETRESAGQYAESIDLYKKAAAETAARPLIQQAARYKQAEVAADYGMADPSKAPDAAKLLEAYVKDYPSSRNTAPALENLARLQLQKGDFARVEKTLTDLAKLPRGADRAAVLKARVSARQGDYAGAVAELDRQIKAAAEGSPRQREARLARAECLAGLKKFTDAETEVRGVIKALPPEDATTQAVAYNTLGDCLRAAGRPKDALMAYLHTDLLYARDKEQHPRALAEISRLWRELKRDDRADEVWQRLKQDYPQSPWLTSTRGTP